MMRNAAMGLSCVAAISVLASLPVHGQVTDRVSVSSAEVQDNTGASAGSYITPNGRFVVFQSSANNLVSPASTGGTQVFVRDRVLGTTSLVSLPDPSLGGQANSGCFLGRNGTRKCSDDGRFVVFSSNANNLVSGDTNGNSPPYHVAGTDVFVRDRDLDGNGIFDELGVGKTKTVRVSLSSSNGNPTSVGSQWTEFSIGLDTYDGGCFDGSISSDGRFVAFECEGDPFSSGPGTIGSNIFRRDRDHDGNGTYDEPGEVCIVPIPPNGCIVSLGVVTELVSQQACNCTGQQFDGFSHDPSISGNGQFVAFASASIYVDQDPSGFQKTNNNLTDVWVRDMRHSQTTRVSVDTGFNSSNGNSDSPSVSDTGRYIAFASTASDLVASDSNGKQDVFVRDFGPSFSVFSGISFFGGSTQRASVGEFFSLLGQPDYFSQLDNNSSDPAISANGQYVGFTTDANNVICGFLGCFDSNNASDVYVRDTVGNTTTAVSVNTAGSLGGGASTDCSVSDDGRTASFGSVAADMVTPDANGTGSDVYVRVLSGAPTLTSVVSRKLHGGTTNFDIPFPLTGTVGSECRVNGPTEVIFTFSEPVHYAGSGLTYGSLNITVNSVPTAGNQVTFNCSNGVDGSCAFLQLGNWVDASGNSISGPKAVYFRILAGDTNGDGQVGAADISQTKTRNGLSLGAGTLDATNFRSDVNADGQIGAADISFVKTHNGHAVNVCP